MPYLGNTPAIAIFPLTIKTSLAMGLRLRLP